MTTLVLVGFSYFFTLGTFIFVEGVLKQYIACIFGLSHKDLLSFCTSNKNKKIDVMFMKFYPNHQFKIISCVSGGFNGLIQ